MYPPMVSPTVQSQLNVLRPVEKAPQQQPPFHADSSSLSPSLREEFFPQMENSPSQNYHNNNTQEVGGGDGNGNGNVPQVKWENVAENTSNHGFWQNPGMTTQDYGFQFNNNDVDVDPRSRLGSAMNIDDNSQFSGLNGGINSIQNWGEPSHCIDPLLLQISQSRMPPGPVDCSDLTVSEEEKRLLGEGWYVNPKEST